jgi:hypothetical protein
MINSKLQQEKIRLDIMSIFSHVSISLLRERQRIRWQVMKKSGHGRNKEKLDVRVRYEEMG